MNKLPKKFSLLVMDNSLSAYNIYQGAQVIVISTMEPPAGFLRVTKDCNGMHFKEPDAANAGEIVGYVDGFVNAVSKGEIKT